MSDAMEARGQDVDQEPADELVSWQAHDPHVITAFDAVVFPPEGHGVGLGADEAMVGDRHTMRVTAEVSLHGLGATEGWFGIDNQSVLRSATRWAAKMPGSANSERSLKNRSLPVLCNLANPSRNKRRNNRDRTFTGRKNPERQTTQPLPSRDSPPPGTMTCKCGWCVIAEPQVCSTEVIPIRAPRCFGSAAIVSSVWAAVLNSRP